MTTDSPRDPAEPSLPAMGLPGVDYEFEAENFGDYDDAHVMLLKTRIGIQPVVWPMKLHVHGPDCGRA